MRYSPVVLVVFAITGITLSACSPSHEGVEVSADVRETDGPAPGAIEYLGSEPVKYTGQPSPYPFELVHDGKLMDFDTEAALSQPVSAQGAWYVRAEMGAPAIDMTKPPAEIDAARVVKIGPVQGRAGLAQTTYPLSLSAARIVGRAWGQAFAPNELALVVEWPGDNDTTRRLIAIHPGDGEWHELVIDEFVYGAPANVRLTYELVRAGRSGGDVFFAPASLRIHDAGTAPLVGSDLVHNGSFDAQAFFEEGSVEPWMVNAWRGNEITDLEVVFDSNTPERHFVVKMPEIETGGLGLLQVFQSLDASVAGKRLEFRIDARCDAPERLNLLLKLFTEGNEEPVQTRAWHPGDGKWHELVATMPVPENANPKQVHFNVVQYPGEGTANIVFDNASVMFVASE